MPTSSPQSKALTRVCALVRELKKDPGYASANSTQAYWFFPGYQKRRSAESIRRKKSECEKLARGLPQGQDLWAAIQGLLGTYAHDWREDWEPRGAIQARQRRFELEYDGLVTGIRGRLAKPVKSVGQVQRERRS